MLFPNSEKKIIDFKFEIHIQIYMNDQKGQKWKEEKDKRSNCFFKLS
jgi:hypothetical protein